VWLVSVSPRARGGAGTSAAPMPVRFANTIVTFTMQAMEPPAFPIRDGQLEITRDHFPLSRGIQPSMADTN
jgi:hypothetical protein